MRNATELLSANACGYLVLVHTSDIEYIKLKCFLYKQKRNKRNYNGFFLCAWFDPVVDVQRIR